MAYRTPPDRGHEPEEALEAGRELPRQALVFGVMIFAIVAVILALVFFL